MKKYNYLFTSLSALSLTVLLGLTGKLSNKSSDNSRFAQSATDEKTIDEALDGIFRLKRDPKTNSINHDDIVRAYDQANKLSLFRLNKSFTWANLGPDNVGGRTRAFLIDKDSANIMLVGSVSGGLFRSTDFAASWKPVNDQQENLAVCSITQLGNGDIFYGTGELFNQAPALSAGGIFVSKNKGRSFTILASTKNKTDFTGVASMATSIDGNTLFAGTTTGFWYSEDGGTTFKRIKTGYAKDIKVGSDGVVWSNIGNDLFKITDWKVAGGYTKMTLGGGTTGRICVAVSPQDPQYVYCIAATSQAVRGAQLEGVYRSINGGTSWTKIHNGGSPYSDPLCQVNTSTDGQGGYDLCIGVDPKDKNRIFMGGVQFAKWDETNGFKMTANLFDAPWNTQNIHADKHLIAWNTKTNPPTLIVGTDGGLYFSYDNGNTFTPKNKGFTSLQLYNVAANSLGHVMGGSQDNGTQLINFTGNISIPGQQSKMAVEITSGDGFDAEFSRIYPKTTFTSTYYGRVYRSNNGGQSIAGFYDKRISTDGASIANKNTSFFTKMALWEPSNPSEDTNSRFFLGCDQELWMAKGVTNPGVSPDWFLLSNTIGGDNDINEIEVSPDGDHVWISKDGKLYRIDSLNSAVFSTTLYPVANAIPKPIKTVNVFGNLPGGRTVTSASLDPKNPNHMVVTLGNYGYTAYIFETNNALSAAPTYTNITGNLPSMPVYDAAIWAYNSKYIILGTDLGVWVSENGGTTWEEANSGMARVPVFEVKQYEWNPGAGTVLYLGTFGRGYYRSNSWYTGINNPNALEASVNNIKAFPNPATSVVNIKFVGLKFTQGEIKITDLSGKAVLTKKVKINKGDNNVEMQLTDFKPGIYFAMISGNKGAVKFLVTK